MALVSTQRKIVLLKISAVIYINNISKHDDLNFWMYLKLHTISFTKSQYTRFAFLMAQIVAQSKIVFLKISEVIYIKNISKHDALNFRICLKVHTVSLTKSIHTRFASSWHSLWHKTRLFSSKYLHNTFICVKLWTIFRIKTRLDVGSPGIFLIKSWLLPLFSAPF